MGILDLEDSQKEQVARLLHNLDSEIVSCRVARRMVELKIKSEQATARAELPSKIREVLLAGGYGATNFSTVISSDGTLYRFNITNGE